VGRYQKGKTNLDFTEARDSEWQWQQLGHVQVCTSLQTDNHASTPPLSFLQAGCLSWHPTNSVKALKAITIHTFKVIAKSGTTTSFVCTGSGIGSSSDIKMRPLRNVYGAVMVYVRTCLAIRDHRL